MAELDSPQQHPKLYKPTGDLVILANDGEATTAFRVHTVILAEHSPVFAGMLALPVVDDDAMEKYDDVPLVRLADSAQDLAALLEVFYTPAHPQFKASDRDFAEHVYPLAMIAAKYQVDSLCRAVAEHLKSQWPTTLEQLLKDTRTVPSHLPRGRMNLAFPEPAAAIRLATDLNVPEILPMAYYVLATYPFDKATRTQPWNFRRPRWHLLHEDECLRAYRGKLELMEENLNMELSYQLDDGDCNHMAPGNYIPGSLPCGRVVEGIKANRTHADFSGISAATKSFARLDPLGSAAQAYRDGVVRSLCFACKAKMKAKFEVKVKELWQGLPDIFSLPQAFASSDS